MNEDLVTFCLVYLFVPTIISLITKRFYKYNTPRQLAAGMFILLTLWPFLLLIIFALAICQGAILLWRNEPFDTSDSE